MEYLKLGEISEFIMGQAPNSANCNKNGSGTIFVKAGQFGELYPNIEEWTVTPLKLAKENDVLICVVGATVGKLNLAIDCAIGRSVAAIRCDSKKLHYKYLYYYLNTWVTRIRELSQGSAIGVITKDMLYDLNIPMYDISSQIYIVNILDKAQKLMDKRKQQIEALDELVKSQFIEMFGDVISNKKNYPIKKLDEITSIITDGTHQTPTYVDKGYIFLSSKNVTTGKINWDDVKYIPEELHIKLNKRLEPKLNDILLAKNGTTGVAALVDRECIFDIYVSLALIRFNSNINPVFMLYMINSDGCRHQFNSSLKGIGVPNLHLSEIRKTKVLLPPIELQNQFADFVKQVDKLKFEMENSLKELEDNFNSLMQKSFKGELFN